MRVTANFNQGTQRRDAGAPATPADGPSKQSRKARGKTIGDAKGRCPKGA